MNQQKSSNDLDANSSSLESEVLSDELTEPLSSFNKAVSLENDTENVMKLQKKLQVRKKQYHKELCHKVSLKNIKHSLEKDIQTLQQKLEATTKDRLSLEKTKILLEFQLQTIQLQLSDETSKRINSEEKNKRISDYIKEIEEELKNEINKSQNLEIELQSLKYRSIANLDVKQIDMANVNEQFTKNEETIKDELHDRFVEDLCLNYSLQLQAIQAENRHLKESIVKHEQFLNEYEILKKELENYKLLVSQMQEGLSNDKKSSPLKVSVQTNTVNIDMGFETTSVIDKNETLSEINKNTEDNEGEKMRSKYYDDYIQEKNKCNELQNTINLLNMECLALETENGILNEKRVQVANSNNQEKDKSNKDLAVFYEKIKSVNTKAIKESQDALLSLSTKNFQLELDCQQLTKENSEINKQFNKLREQLISMTEDLNSNSYKLINVNKTNTKLNLVNKSLMSRIDEMKTKIDSLTNQRIQNNLVEKKTSTDYKIPPMAVYGLSNVMHILQENNDKLKNVILFNVRKTYPISI